MKTYFINTFKELKETMFKELKEKYGSESTSSKSPKRSRSHKREATANLRDEDYNNWNDDINSRFEMAEAGSVNLKINQ